MSVSLGTVVQVDSDADYPLDACQLSSTLSLVIYERAGNYYARTVSIAAPPTVNAESASIDPGSGGAIQAVLAPMTSTSCMLIYKYNGTTAMRARVLTVAGTTVTANAHITLTGTASADMGACMISSTKTLFVWEDSASTDLNSVVLSVSGTTITENTIELVDSESSIVGPKCAVFSTTKSIVVWKDISGQFEARGAIVNISGNNLTAQTPKAISGAGVSDSDPNDNFLALMSSTKVVHGVVDTGFTQDIYNVLTLNGNTFDVGADTTVSHANLDGLCGAALDSTSLIIASEQPANSLKVAKYDITGAGSDELTIDSTAVLALTTVNQIYAAPVDVTNIIIHFIGSSSSVVLATFTAASHIWLSTDGAATFSNIGDPAWGSDVVGGVVVVPGTAYQTIYAAVGSNLYKTTDGGSSWSLETAISYEVDSIELKKDNTTVILANNASGGNRASEWDGTTLTHLNTGKSTTGGATVITSVV